MVEIIVLVGVPSLTTIAEAGWGCLKVFIDEKFGRNELSQAAQAPPRDSSSLFSLLQKGQRSPNRPFE